MSHLQEYKSQQTLFLKNILVHQGCCNKIPQTGWLKQQKSLFSQFWKLEVWGQMLARLFFGMTSLYDYLLEGLLLKLKLQYFGHLMQRSDSLKKTLMLGKVEGKRRRGQQRMRWLACSTNSMDMNLSRLQVIVKNRDFWHAVVHGVTKNWTQLSNWTTASFCFANSIFSLYPQWPILCAPPERSNLWFSSSYKNPSPSELGAPPILSHLNLITYTGYTYVDTWIRREGHDLVLKKRY